MSRIVVVALGALVLGAAACSGDDEPTATPAPLDVPETVAMGVLPEPLPDTLTLPAPPLPSTTAAVGSTTAAPVEPLTEPVADHVDGDRLLLIGDALLASTEQADEAFVCDALSVFGWDTEINAQPTTELAVLADVLDARLPSGNSGESSGDQSSGDESAADGPDQTTDWDVIGVVFGSELDGADPGVAAAFGEAVDALVVRVAPRPVLLFTLPVTDLGRAELNDVIRERPALHDNVLVVDFAERGGAANEVVDDSGLELTEDGNRRLAVITASVLGEAPVDDAGQCLEAP